MYMQPPPPPLACWALGLGEPYIYISILIDVRAAAQTQFHTSIYVNGVNAARTSILEPRVFNVACGLTPNDPPLAGGPFPFAHLDSCAAACDGY